MTQYLAVNSDYPDLFNVSQDRAGAFVASQRGLDVNLCVERNPIISQCHNGLSGQVPTSHFIRADHKMSMEDTTAYDSMCAAFAEMRGCDFWKADEKFANTAQQLRRRLMNVKFFTLVDRL